MVRPVTLNHILPRFELFCQITLNHVKSRFTGFSVCSIFVSRPFVCTPFCYGGWQHAEEHKLFSGISGHTSGISYVSKGSTVMFTVSNPTRVGFSQKSSVILNISKGGECRSSPVMFGGLYTPILPHLTPPPFFPPKVIGFGTCQFTLPVFFLRRQPKLYGGGGWAIPPSTSTSPPRPIVTSGTLQSPQVSAHDTDCCAGLSKTLTCCLFSPDLCLPLGP